MPRAGGSNTIVPVRVLAASALLTRMVCSALQVQQPTDRQLLDDGYESQGGKRPNSNGLVFQPSKQISNGCTPPPPDQQESGGLHSVFGFLPRNEQTPPKFREKTPKRWRKDENCGWRGKKREVMGSPRPPFFCVPPFGAHSLHKDGRIWFGKGVIASPCSPPSDCKYCVHPSRESSHK